MGRRIATAIAGICRLAHSASAMSLRPPAMPRPRPRMFLRCRGAGGYHAILSAAVPGPLVQAHRESGSLVPRKTAFVAGATGAVGTALASHLVSLDGWTVTGVSRRAPEFPVRGVSYLCCDLLDPAACARALAPLPPVTHLFYCARVTHSDQPVESTSQNLRLLENAIEAVGQASSELRHVHLVQGGKYYGVHLGPFPNPAREDQARCAVTNFYHAQQDYLWDCSNGADWNWSASRPNTLLHYSPDIARNIVSTLGCYASICGELGVPLDFPGPVGAYDSLTQVTSLKLLARTMERIVTDPGCADQAFNVTNTDVFRWNAVWPRFAQRTQVEAGAVRPTHLAEAMADKEVVWQRVCERHRLRPTKMSDVANWPFADATLERDWDEILCHNRARGHGLDGWDDSVARFFKILKKYQSARILP